MIFPLLLHSLGIALADHPPAHTASPGPAPTKAAADSAPAVPPLPAAVATRESARYRVTYGVLGDLGEVSIELSPIAAPGTGVRAIARGQGSVLGMGAVEKRFDSEFDPDTRSTRRWKHTRSQGDKLTEDTVEETAPGVIALVRRRNGTLGMPEGFQREAPVFDPVGFLLRLRLALPTASQRLEVLDGRALWVMTVQPPRRQPLDGPGSPAALRIDGHAAPVFWNGAPDPARDARPFTVWLADDAFRTPLRLAMPLGFGEVRVDLVSLSRSPHQQPSFVRRLLLARLAPWIRAPG